MSPAGMPEHYPTALLLDGTTRWIIWTGDDTDGVVVENGFVITFDDLDALAAYAGDQGLALSPTAEIDLDEAREWTSEPAVEPILDALNMATDIARSTGGRFQPGDEID